MTRRRRRRRGGAKTDETEEPLVRRSRKQQYIDEITTSKVPPDLRPRSSVAVTIAVSAAVKASSWSRTSWLAASMSTA